VKTRPSTKGEFLVNNRKGIRKIKGGKARTDKKGRERDLFCGIGGGSSRGFGITINMPSGEGRKKKSSLLKSWCKGERSCVRETGTVADEEGISNWTLREKLVLEPLSTRDKKEEGKPFSDARGKGRPKVGGRLVDPSRRGKKDLLPTIAFRGRNDGNHG